MENFNGEQLIKQAREDFPEAENDIVAVDLAAQAEWRNIQRKAGAGISMQELKSEVDKYHYLNWLRSSLLNKAVQVQSDFMIEEAKVDIENLEKLNLG